MSKYETEKRGVLFVNDKENDKQPDFSGNCEIEGVEYKVAGWKKPYKNDPTKELISLLFSLPEKKEKEIPF